MTATIERTWSEQQVAVFNWFENATNHLVVSAYAGTGKTTTIIEGVKRADKALSILVCAFSKSIKEELDKRIAGLFNVKALTFHALGFSCVNRFRDRIRLDKNNERADGLTETVCGKAAPDAIKRLVTKLHTKGRLMAPHATKLGELTAIAITFECEPDAGWASSGFDLAYIETKALEVMELASNVKSGDIIDFTDMIFLPVRNHWLTKQYDRVIVDETQDMTIAQLEIAEGVLRDGGLMCLVGDRNQAIFSFIGADSGSLDRLKIKLNAQELGLTVTYRCGRAIVDEARRYVPDFEAGPNNSDGSIENIFSDKLVGMAGPGDFVLSRVNAPLVSTAMKLLRAGKRTRVAGKDIGKGLTALVRKLKGRSVPDLLARIETWATKENSRYESQLGKATNGRKAAIQAKMEAIMDQRDMMLSLADGANNVAEVESRIENLFTDDGLGAAGMITCSSVHRAKGLEASRVFVLADTLRDNSVEERNIAYVAITRAKDTLVWVHKAAA